MRGLVFDELRKLMEHDESIFFLTGDMGINLVEVIDDAFPDRFLNVGIAEQDLIGVAAGLSNVGYRPVVYTIGNFLVHRCYEQIRDDVALHGYPLVLLGTSAGFDNASLGPTHHLIDDWGPLRNLPGVDVYAPASTEFATGLLERVLATGRAAYLRVAKGAPSIPGTADDVSYLPGIGDGPLLVTYGSLAVECLAVQEQRPEVSVLVLNKVHPVDPADVVAHLQAHSSVLVVEDHFGHTGLYGSLCILAMEQGVTPRMTSVAPDHEYCLVVEQTPKGYWRRYGLDAAGIIERLDRRDGSA
jgi:transketolase